MKQRTQEWIDMRKNHIMASDAPVIVGVSPWRTQNQLWREKLGLGPAQQENSAMRHGIEREQDSRLAYQVYTGISVEPDIVFNPNIKYMGASLDGISRKKKRMVELKNPGEKDHQIAQSGKIPEKYIPQVQHQLACVEHLGIDIGHYFSFRNGDMALVEFEKDQEYLDYLQKEEKEFWDMMVNFKEPALTDRDYQDMSESSIWKEISSRCISRYSKIKDLKNEDEEDRKILKEICNEQNAQGHGIKYTRFMRKGSIDYSKIPQLKDVDLEVYRGNPSLVWRLSF